MDHKKVSINLKSYLDQAAKEYNKPGFIPDDPISVPHQYSRKEDIEIAGLFTAILSWGQRRTIIRNSFSLMSMMENSPYEFITQAKEQEIDRFQGFVHRTFNEDDCLFFIHALRRIYLESGGLEESFNKGYRQERKIFDAIMKFRDEMFLTPHLKRSEKHLSDPSAGSAAKRINMFLRWMVRKDTNGVDFGIWKEISPTDLMCPLDVHSGRIARKLGLLTRKQDDWKAVEELTAILRKFDPADPVKYDYALFCLDI